MWVKICGNTNFEDARTAVDAGANALGFVFARSPRRVTVDQVAEITGRLAPTVERYGVFVEPTFEEVVETVRGARLTGVQLHTASDPLLPMRLREFFSAGPVGKGFWPKRLGLLKVLHLPPTVERQVESQVESQPQSGADSGALEAQLELLQNDFSVDAILIDSRTATAPGGTGLRFDWAAASGAFIKSAPHLRMIAAGGLSPENVAEAIATLRPWGVDVVTGVEAEPGRKDPIKVRAFISRARATARALGSTKFARA